MTRLLVDTHLYTPSLAGCQVFGLVFVQVLSVEIHDAMDI